MAQTKTVHTLERARDAFVNIRSALEEKTGNSLDNVVVEQYDDIISNIKINTLQSNKTINPDLSQGDVVVNPDSDYDGLEQITILKDSNLISGNIKDGKNIYGIVGNLITEMIPEFSDSNPKTEADGGLSTPETEELRALLTINNVIHLFCNANHYTFNELTETWTLVDSSEYFCGKNYHGQPDVKENGAVLIGDNVVWIGITSSGFVHVRYYNVTSGVVGNDIDLGAPAGFISCMTTDGKDLYLFDKNAKKIRKVEIDFANNTATSSYINITFTNTIKKMAFLNDVLYGYDTGTPAKLISVDFDNLTYTETVIDSNVGDSNRMFAVTDDAIFIGSGTYDTSHVIYKWDGTSLTTYDTLEVGYYSGKSAWTVCNNKLYMYGYKVGSLNVYTPVFEARARKVGEHLVINPTSTKQTFNNNIKYTKIVVLPTS